MSKPPKQPKAQKPANRTEEGRFQSGVSGNPSGRPAVAKSLQELARTYTAEAIEALRDALKNPRERVYAATALLDRGYGRPIQTQSIRVIRTIEDLSDAELAALAGTDGGTEEIHDGTRH